MYGQFFFMWPKTTIPRAPPLHVCCPLLTARRVHSVVWDGWRYSSLEMFSIKDKHAFLVVGMKEVYCYFVISTNDFNCFLTFPLKKIQPRQLCHLRLPSAPIQPTAENQTGIGCLLLLALTRLHPPSSSQTPPWRRGEAWLFLSPPLLWFLQFFLQNLLHHIQPLSLPSRRHQLLILGNQSRMKKARALTLKFHLHPWSFLRAAQVLHSRTKGERITFVRKCSILEQVSSEIIINRFSRKSKWLLTKTYKCQGLLTLKFEVLYFCLQSFTIQSPVPDKVFYYNEKFTKAWH